MRFALPSQKNVRRTLALLVTVASWQTLTSCGSSHEQFVQVRAADDFECVADGIDVEEIGRSRYVARGCGKQGEYVCSATPDGVDCSQTTDLDVESPSTLATAQPASAPSGGGI